MKLPLYFPLLPSTKHNGRDENKRSDDQLYGNARTSIGKILLNGGTLDVEVEHEKSEKKKTSNFNIKKSYIRSNQSNMFITVECSKL